MDSSTRLGRLFMAVFLLMVGILPSLAQDTVKVGSKRFTESYVLGEIVALAEV